ncbi:LuxR C-terminal-related transcriptional regulator [Kribbella sp. NPDC051770]|uniref:helix-turn-helix transcriptional regulator n=1 Tax=Kribbella sp. NPDC051770 TaxID=3155413 RepID=UPI003418BB6C
MSGFATAPTQGRAAEQNLVQAALERAANGRDGVLLIDGEPGIGKSHLLHDSADQAVAYGFAVVTGTADPVGEALPLLQAARASGPSAPVLICLDDLHWASPTSMAAVRTLPKSVDHLPIAWLLARSTTTSRRAADLFDLLEKDGATRITLGPLPDTAVTAMLANTLGQRPSAALERLAAGASGNPALVAALLRGLREEHATGLTGDGAEPAPSSLPHRVHRLTRHRLDELSTNARQLLTTAAVMGPAFDLDDVADMVGSSPAALLPALEEALDSALITVQEETFAFRHPLLQRAIAELIPRPARSALVRQYGGVAPTPHRPEYPTVRTERPALDERSIPWTRANEAEKLGVDHLTNGEYDAAIECWQDALVWYDEAGADTDGARVRSRLRKTGVRTRHWKTGQRKPRHGWDSLTGTEQDVARRAAEGLNNKQIGARMYISPHTVAHHLRQMFRKLGISSRVELVRLVLEAGSPSVPDGLTAAERNHPIGLRGSG